MFDKQGLERLASGRSGRLARWRAALMAVTVLTAAGFALAGGAVAGDDQRSAALEE